MTTPHDEVLERRRRWRASKPKERPTAMTPEATNKPDLVLVHHYKRCGHCHEEHMVTRPDEDPTAYCPRKWAWRKVVRFGTAVEPGA